MQTTSTLTAVIGRTTLIPSSTQPFTVDGFYLASTLNNSDILRCSNTSTTKIIYQNNFTVSGYISSAYYFPLGSSCEFQTFGVGTNYALINYTYQDDTSTMPAITEMCVTTGTTQSCYRSLDIYYGFAIEGVFVAAVILILAWIRNK